VIKAEADPARETVGASVQFINSSKGELETKTGPSPSSDSPEAISNTEQLTETLRAANGPPVAQAADQSVSTVSVSGTGASSQGKAVGLLSLVSSISSASSDTPAITLFAD